MVAKNYFFLYFSKISLSHTLRKLGDIRYFLFSGSKWYIFEVQSKCLKIIKGNISCCIDIHLAGWDSIAISKCVLLTIFAWTKE